MAISLKQELWILDFVDGGQSWAMSMIQVALNQSEPINLAAMAVHHIIDEDLVDCKPYTTFNIPNKLNTRYLIGHNIDYDIKAMQRTGFDFNAQLRQSFEPICTLAMARRLWLTLGKAIH